MRAVVDTNYFINRQLLEMDITTIYLTPSVEIEIKDRMTQEYQQMLNYKIEIRRPAGNTEWISEERAQDVETVRCLTNDNGIKAALRKLELDVETTFENRRYRMRCYACYMMYDEEMDFCTNCGYSTITRVTVMDEGNKERILLRKNYIPRRKVIKDSRGKEIISGGQREYRQYLIEKIQRKRTD